MKHSRLSSNIGFPLFVLILIASLTVGTGACTNLGSDDDSSNTSDAPTETKVSTNDQGRIPADYILFRDDFQDGDTQGWRIDGAWVVRQNGDLYTFDTSGLGYAFVPAGIGWEGDYALKASYLLESGTLAFSFDATNGGRYYVPIDQEHISLVKQDSANNKTVLTQAEAPKAGDLHYITIAKQKGTIQVYVDRTLWLAAQDSSPLTVGTVAVGSAEGTTASVDNVLVNKIARTLPPGTPTVPAIVPGQVVQPSDDGADLGELPAPDDNAPDLSPNNQGLNLPEPEVLFVASSSDDVNHTEKITVPADRFLTLSWSVQNANGVFLDGTAQPLTGQFSLGPEEVYDHTYELEVLALDGRTLTYYMEVTVDGGDQSDVHGPNLTISCQVEYHQGTQVLVTLQLRNIGDEGTDLRYDWYPLASEGQAIFSAIMFLGAGEEVSILPMSYDYGQSGTMHWKASIKTQPEGLDVDTSNNSVRGTVTVQP